VLFADLKGSMELLADRDPEEARKLLDPVLEHMMEAVHQYEGTVNLSAHGQARADAGAPHHRDHDVPRDGHGVLAAASGDGVAETGMRVATLIAILDLHPRQTRATGRHSYTNLANPVSHSYRCDGFRSRLIREQDDA
jgi:class 3 adenylate cyclase